MTSEFRFDLYSILRVLRTQSTEDWNELWQADPTCRQTKLWFPEVDYLKARQLLTLPRVELGESLRWITGHNFTRRHQHLLDPARYRTNTCRLCHQEQESPEHLLTDCTVLGPFRRRFLQHETLPKPYQWTTDALRNFLEKVASHMEADEGSDDFQVLTRDGSWQAITLPPVATSLSDPPVVGPPQADTD